VPKHRSLTKIRLHGIVCLETGQDFGTRARSLASKLRVGQVVTVRTVATGYYRWTVGELVPADRRMLNREENYDENWF
jgi:hypothetical protein